jgi:hypothetical protein
MSYGNRGRGPAADRSNGCACFAVDCGTGKQRKNYPMNLNFASGADDLRNTSINQIRR